MLPGRRTEGRISSREKRDIGSSRPPSRRVKKGGGGRPRRSHMKLFFAVAKGPYIGGVGAYGDPGSLCKKAVSKSHHC